MTFKVCYADGSDITDWKEICKEEWANYLDSDNIYGFLIDEDGYLILMEKNGGAALCPPGKKKYKIVYSSGFDLDQYEEVY